MSNDTSGSTPPPYTPGGSSFPGSNSQAPLSPLSVSNGHLTPVVIVPESRFVGQDGDKDPFVDALQHTLDIQALHKRCINNASLQATHLGELVTEMTKLLEKARKLDAISIREELQQLKAMLKDTVQAQARSSLPMFRVAVWRTAGLLLQDIQSRLSEQHLQSGIESMTKAISDIENTISRSRVTQ